MLETDDNPLAFVAQCANVYEAVPALNNESTDYYIIQTLQEDDFTITDSRTVSYNLKVVQEVNPYSFVKAALVRKEDPTKPAFLTVTKNDNMILTVFQ